MQAMELNRARTTRALGQCLQNRQLKGDSCEIILKEILLERPALDVYKNGCHSPTM